MVASAESTTFSMSSRIGLITVVAARCCLPLPVSDRQSPFQPQCIATAAFVVHTASRTLRMASSWSGHGGVLSSSTCANAIAASLIFTSLSESDGPIA